MDVSPGRQRNGSPIALPVTSGCVDPATVDAGGALISAATNGESAPDLPTRPAPDRHLVRKIRRLDDPEILQRVLSGLLNLQ